MECVKIKTYDAFVDGVSLKPSMCCKLDIWEASIYQPYIQPTCFPCKISVQFEAWSRCIFLCIFSVFFPRTNDYLFDQLSLHTHLTCTFHRRGECFSAYRGAQNLVWPQHDVVCCYPPGFVLSFVPCRWGSVKTKPTSDDQNCKGRPVMSYYSGNYFFFFFLLSTSF